MRAFLCLVGCIVLLACASEEAQGHKSLELHELGVTASPELLERVRGTVRRGYDEDDDDDDDDDDFTCPPFSPELAQTFQGTIHSFLQTGVELVAVDNTRLTDGTWTVDTVGGRLRLQGDTGTGTAPLSQPTLPLDMAWLPSPGWSQLNGQCRETEPYDWADQWGWLGCATLDGTVECSPTDGEEVLECSRYSIGDDSFFVGVTIWEVPDEGVAVPVGFDTWFLYSLGAGLVNSTTYYTLEDVQLDIPEEAFVQPPYCALEPPACPDSEDSVSIMEFTRIHPAEDWKFSNRNIADVLGDVGYICEIPAESNDSLMTVFEMAVNTTWGQYGLCNADVCVGGTPGTVGHTGTDHYGQPLAGQCSGNEGIGNWFSISEESECQEGEEVGDNGCAWKGPLRILKTITHACLVERGFMEACATDERYPFENAFAIAQAALLPEDDGGCPDVTEEYLTYDSTSPTVSSGSSYASLSVQSSGEYPSSGPSDPAGSEVSDNLSDNQAGATSDDFSTGETTLQIVYEDTDGTAGGEGTTPEADYVFIALSFGCMALACLVVSAVVAYGVVSYVKSRPQQFGWAIADGDDGEDVDVEAA